MYARTNMSKCNRIPAVQWTRTSNQVRFEHTLQKLHEYVGRFGCIPRVTDRFAGVNLGEWCHNRRTDFREGKLGADNVSALEAVDGWTWDVPQSRGAETRALEARRRFKQALAALADFRAQHSRNPKAGEAHRGINLGKWIDNRRQDLRLGRLHADDAAALLQALR